MSLISSLALSLSLSDLDSSSIVVYFFSNFSQPSWEFLDFSLIRRDLERTMADEIEKKAGGVAFDVILKPATAENPPPLHHHGSPTKEKPLSQADIERKLKEAEERRLSMEAAKLQALNKEKEKLLEASQKAHEKNEAFAKEAEKKLAEKMEASEEKKKAQEQARLERLKEHERHAEEVRQKKLSMSEDGPVETS